MIASLFISLHLNEPGERLISLKFLNANFVSSQHAPTVHSC